MFTSLIDSFTLMHIARNADSLKTPAEFLLKKTCEAAAKTTA